MRDGDAIESVVKLLEIVELVSKNMGPSWWRGQTSNWELRPGVFRDPRQRRHEGTLVQEFKLRARTRHSNCPPEDDLPGWLFLMQHYRLPTRLLDWSASPLIALFFAVKDEPLEGKQPETGALFALSPMELNRVQLGKDDIVPANSKDDASLLFKGIFEPKPDAESYNAAAIGANEIDNRMLMQLAQFTIHDTDKPLQALDRFDSFLFHFEVPAITKSNIKRELSNLGISESNIFPDLEHLATDLAEKYKNRPF